MYSACQVSYSCQVTGDLQKEIFHATPTWQNSGPQYDSVIIQGQQRSSFLFAKVCALFSVSVDSETFGVAIIKPFIRKPQNKLTGHIELEGPKEGHFEFCFIEYYQNSSHSSTNPTHSSIYSSGPH